MQAQHRTAAWPLALIYAGLIVYASLYPFSGWRDQGDLWWAFVWAPWPRYWTGFDLVINVVGYLPLGFLLTLATLRSGALRSAAWVLAIGTIVACLLSLGMESLQQLLPTRVPSNVDWGTNTVGALLGSVLAWTLERWGVIAHWSRFRTRWFERDSRSALVLLTLWPFALLFPAPAALGLGQVLERGLIALSQTFADSSWVQWLPDMELAPLSPAAEMLVVCMGLCVPVLLAYSIVPNWARRLAALLAITTLALVMSSLSALLSFGPAHIGVWITPATQAGLTLALMLGVVSLAAGERTVLALALMASLIGLALINQAPSNAYFVQNLAAWEQGRFVRFHGLAQWLGWLWPFVALGHVFGRLVRR